MVMQEIKEQPAYYSMAAGRQAVTARRERLLEHTHTLSPIHTCSHSEGKICLPAQRCWETYYCCNLFVYKTHLDEWLQKKERLWVTATVFNCMSHSLVSQLIYLLYGDQNSFSVKYFLGQFELSFQSMQCSPTNVQQKSKLRNHSFLMKHFIISMQCRMTHE